LSDKKLTVSKESTYTLRSNKCTFIAYLFPLAHVAEFKKQLNVIKKEYAKASHFCFAYQCGEPLSTRANDDGEPSGSAGLPILGQLKSNQLINVGCIVVRYYGGTKLGIPGLIAAYKNACLGAILSNEPTPHIEFLRIQVQGAYPSLMRFLSIATQHEWNATLNSVQEEHVIHVQIEQEQKQGVINKISLFSDLTWS